MLIVIVGSYSVCHYTECHYSKCFGAKLPQRGRDGVLELEPSWLSVDLQRHQVNLSVVEFDPAAKVKKTFQSECNRSPCTFLMKAY
jgi:hypothetical protein